MTTKRSYHLKPGSDTWHDAWRALFRRFDDLVSSNGEAWQYMGTYYRPAGGWMHEWRHREYRGERVYARTPAPPPNHVPLSEVTR